MRRANKLVALWVVLWVFPLMLYASPGVQWLSEQTNPDGSQGVSTDIVTTFQSTAEALRVYHALDEFPPAGTAEPLSFINDDPTENA